MKNLAIVLTLAVALLSSDVVGAADPKSITHVTGGLYRVHAGGNYHTAFLVTSDGIIVFDPINREAAEWLNKELQSRFDLPVKYLIYSHSDEDHSLGGDVFADAIVIGHEKTKAALLENGTETAIPSLTFSDEMTLKLGDGIVKLKYLGVGHGDNLALIHFPNERAVLCVDIVFVKRLAYGAIGQSPDEPSNYIPGWIRSLHVLESIDYDILLPAHGIAGNKTDGIEFRRYFEALYAAVLNAKQNGTSLESAKASIRLDDFSHLGMYEEWLSLNVEGMYKMIDVD
jgi:glyoxylase-like metal-dependent hydrolase (beta-lactamase superfamily II)